MDTSRVKILLVEDSATALMVLKEVFSEYQVKTVSSGEEAILMASSYKPDIVILDVVLPGIDGFGTCASLRKRAELSHTKIIMLSAKTDIKERLRGYQAGANDYVSKPFNKVELREKVNVFARLKSTEAIDRIKHNLITLLSHEIRTPFNQIFGSLDSIRDNDDFSDKERADFLGFIREGAESLFNLFEKFELVNKLKFSEFELKKEMFSVESVLDECFNDLNLKIEQKQINVVKNCSAKFVNLDKNLFKKSMTYLIDNAVKFSLNGQRVSVLVDYVDNALQIIVQDDGVGCDLEFGEATTDEFNLSRDFYHHTKGHGLSLSIVNQFVRLSGGEIKFDSTPGNGCSVIMRIPQTHMKEPDIVDVTDEDEIALITDDHS